MSANNSSTPTKRNWMPRYHTKNVAPANKLGKLGVRVKEPSGFSQPKKGSKA